MKMNKPLRLIPALFFCALLSLTACDPGGNADAEFWVRGNCSMCKETIETSLEEVRGVASASYDLETNLVSIRYDSAAVAVPALHKACATAGYDTKLEKASRESHDALPKCCQKKAAS